MEIKVMERRTANIKISCGIGDFISFCTRLKSFKQKNSVEDVHFHVAGGWKNVSDLICEIGKPLVKHNVISSIGKYPLAFADVEANWIPVESTLNLPMELPYRFPTFPEDSKYSKYITGRICAIQPVTADGNFEGFIPNRYLLVDKWVSICESLHNKSFQIVLLGGEADKGYLPNNCIDLDLCGKTTIREALYILQNCNLFVGNNSWMWEVAAYCGIPTVCSYLTNYQLFCKIHTPNMNKPDHGIPNLRITESKDLPVILPLVKEMAHKALEV